MDDINWGILQKGSLRDDMDDIGVPYKRDHCHDIGVLCKRDQRGMIWGYSAKGITEG